MRLPTPSDVNFNNNAPEKPGEPDTQPPGAIFLMDLAAFEALAAKVETAVSRIESLKQDIAAKDSELEGLRGQISEAVARAESLEQNLAAKDGELESLKSELSQRSENLNEAGDRVRDLVSRLEAALV
jgi:chromosome segregation ATPase